MTDKIAFACAYDPGVDHNVLFLIGEDGTELWKKEIGDDDTPPTPAIMWAVAIDPDGYVYTCGATWEYIATGPGVSKWTNAGALVWSVLPSIYSTPWHSIAVTPDGHVIIGGNRQLISPGIYGNVFCLAAADGATEWYKDTGAAGAVYYVAADAAGNVYAVANNALWSWEPDGTQRWTTAVAARGLAIDPTGTWLYTGSATELVRRFATATGIEDTAGDWPIDLNINNLCYVADISCDRSGYLYVGYTTGVQSYWGVRKYDADAAFLWDTTPTGCGDVADVSASSSGYVYVSGTTTPGDVGGGFKLLAETGADIPLGWPKNFPDDYAYVAASPGAVGAFPSAWPSPLPPPNIYVGNVLFE